jgi:hypothetical protein
VGNYLDAASGARLSDTTRFAKGVDFGVGEDFRADEEALACGAFKGEHSAAAGDHVEGELGVLPIFELRAGHVEGLVVDGAELDVGVSDHELVAGIAHGGAAVATAAGLVEEEVAVLGAESAHKGDGGGSGEDLEGENGHCWFLPSVFGGEGCAPLEEGLGIRH